MPTHEVTNQPPPLVNYNAYSTDEALKEAVQREGGEWGTEHLLHFGRWVGSEEAIKLGFQANTYKPALKTHDPYGNRLDLVEYDPAYHQFMRKAVEFGLHTSPWANPKAGAHVVRAALMMMDARVESGHGCPISMTYAVVPSLKKQTEVFNEWEAKLYSTRYDLRFLPSFEKTGVIMGMAMTEKQGGSDVRANTTRANPAGHRTGPGAEYLLTGHKWFCSAPMSDAFLVLAQTDKGLSCFFLPRHTPDGQKNNFLILRLKDKLGNCSNASSEIELDSAWSRMVGEEGRGVPTIMEMTNHTRLDCIIGTTGIMREAVSLAVHHASFRKAFGKKLGEHPLMQNLLADMALETEASILLMMRLAKAYDQKENPFESALRRIATAVGKYWICKRGVLLSFEALECWGGNGYVEESLLARLYRDAPVNSVWEGSGNVICLDVLRAMRKEPETCEALMTELNLARGANSRLDNFLEGLKEELGNVNNLESRSRLLVEKMALALEGSLLVRYGPTALSDAFMASRLDPSRGHQFGTLPSGVDFKALIERGRTKIY